MPAFGARRSGIVCYGLMVSKDNHRQIIAHIDYPNDPRNLSAKSWGSVSSKFLYYNGRFHPD